MDLLYASQMYMSKFKFSSNLLILITYLSYTNIMIKKK